MTAKNIREFRVRRGYSQSELADRAGLSTRTIQRIESGEVRPYPDTLTRLAGALEVPLDEITSHGGRKSAADRPVILFHLSALTGFMVPLAQLWAPYLLWLLYRGEHRELDGQLREVMAFHAVTTLLFVSGLMLVYFSQPAGYALAGATIVFCTGITLRNAYTLSQEGTYTYRIPFLHPA